MPVLISMLRGINVGGHNKIKMDGLRALYESLKFEDPHTYVQSGNIIFRTPAFRNNEKNVTQLAKRIQDAIARDFGFRPAVILRTPEEFKNAIAANPFSRRKDIDPARLLVTFLASEPSAEARAQAEWSGASPGGCKPSSVALAGCAPLPPSNYRIFSTRFTLGSRPNRFG